MSIKNVRAFNEAIRSINKGSSEMSKAIEANTSEIKKIVKAIDDAKEEARVDWKKVERLGESERYPLAKGSPQSIEVDGAALLLKKLDIL
ncbi:MAG: hypothetical protein CMJ16_03980 [Peredibacter sp.]|nr:hypothetical protein [Peredibacter sp.]|tara:strand:+ start:817 stop:1086 length:270 start_codon:yes stop_codon:yes gene_type:complete